MTISFWNSKIDKDFIDLLNALSGNTLLEIIRILINRIKREKNINTKIDRYLELISISNRIKSGMIDIHPNKDRVYFETDIKKLELLNEYIHDSIKRHLYKNDKLNVGIAVMVRMVPMLVLISYGEFDGRAQYFRNDSMIKSIELQKMI